MKVLNSDFDVGNIVVYTKEYKKYLVENKSTILKPLEFYEQEFTVYDVIKFRRMKITRLCLKDEDFLKKDLVYTVDLNPAGTSVVERKKFSGQVFERLK